MTHHTLALVFGWAAVLVSLWAAIAQYRRASRLGVEGISTATWVLFVLVGCFWIVYGIATHSWQIIMGSLIVLPIQLAIVFRLKPWRRLDVVTRSAGFFVVVCLLPTLPWGWAGGVYGSGVAVVANRGPQLVELVRQRDASGVSVASWLLGVLGSVLWVAFYDNMRLWAALTATGFAGLANLSIALLAAWRHRQARQRLTLEAVFTS